MWQQQYAIHFLNTTLHYILQSGRQKGENTIISITHQIDKQPTSHDWKFQSIF